MKIYKQITPYNWRKGATSVLDDYASCCSICWIAKVYKNDYHSSLKKFMEANDIKRDEISDSNTISSWNDDSTRTFEQVKEAFRKADL